MIDIIVHLIESILLYEFISVQLKIVFRRILLWQFFIQLFVELSFLNLMSFLCFSHFLLVLVINFVLAKNCVPETEKRWIISDIMRVMEVVIRGRSRKGNQSIRTPREFIATMAIKWLTDSHQAPHHECRKMHLVTKYQRSHTAWNNCSKDKINWMRILSCDSYSSNILVMNFVNIRVNSLPVE